MVDLNRSFGPGDRVRYETVGDDGFPLVRYGFVGSESDSNDAITVMLDGELSGDVVQRSTIQAVEIGTVTLVLQGSDLVDDPTLRRGLVNLWRAEAEDAGLQIAAIHPVQDGLGVRDSSEGYALAELSAAGEQYMLRATTCPNTDAVMIAAARPNRFIF